MNFFNGFKLNGGDCFSEDINAYSSIPAALNKNAFVPFCDDAVKNGCKRLYVPSLDIPDADIDKLIDYTLTVGAELAVMCSRTLTEVGKTDVRFNKSPVMCLYDFGLLACSRIISGVYLDKDDLSLMAQEGVTLTVLPSADSGYGFGIAPVRAALERGVKINLGTYNGAFNPLHDIITEARALRLLVSAQMNEHNAVSVTELAKMCFNGEPSKEELNKAEKQIQGL